MLEPPLARWLIPPIIAPAPQYFGRGVDRRVDFVWRVGQSCGLSTCPTAVMATLRVPPRVIDFFKDTMPFFKVAFCLFVCLFVRLSDDKYLKSLLYDLLLHTLILMFSSVKELFVLSVKLLSGFSGSGGQRKS